MPFIIIPITEFQYHNLNIYLSDLTMSSTNLGNLLSSLKESTFGIPTDVTFKIMSDSNPAERDEDKDEYVLGEVKGHKLILGLFSPVFKCEFFGAAKETKDTISVRQTTLVAFEKMIDHIYQKEIDWSQLSVLELFDVVNLAEKYDVTSLMEEMEEQMTNIPIKTENLMDVATTAAQFNQFPIASSALLLSCAKFLRTTHQTSDELVKIAANQTGQGQGEIVLHLLALVRDLPPPQQAKCNNCGEVECLNGKGIVTPGKLTPGLKLASIGIGVNGDIYTSSRLFTVVEHVWRSNKS